MHPALEYYAHQSAITDPGINEILSRWLPQGMSMDYLVVQGIIMHPAEAHRYEVKPRLARMRAFLLRSVEQKLPALGGLGNDHSFAQPSLPERRVPGNCRDYAVMLCGLRRYQGTPDKRMKREEDALDAQLTINAQARPSSAPPATSAEMLAAEAAPGFALPLLLRRLYLEVSNGDFGPGLLPLYEKPSASNRSPIGSLVNHYLEWHSTPREEIEAIWGDTEQEDRPMPCPDKLLTICDWGCNIPSCLDCAKPACPVLRNDNDVSFRTFALETPSLHAWLEAWLDRRRLFWLDWNQAEKVTFSFSYREE